MNHINPNMIAMVLKGIADAEASPAICLDAHYAILGLPIRRTEAFLTAKAIAYSQGFIAAQVSR